MQSTKKNSSGQKVNFFKDLSSSAKIFVLDTNVLIHDPSSLKNFGNNGVVLPLVAIEELDHLKKGNGEIPYSARQALRIIDAIREERKVLGETLKKGVKTPDGGMLLVFEAKINHLRNDKKDNWIISVAKEIQDMHRNRKVIFVSKDTAARLKAEAIGLGTEDYKSDKTSLFSKYGKILREEDYNNGIRSVRYQLSGERIDRITDVNHISLVKRRKEVMGIAPKNVGQECAIEALTNPDTQIVALTGIAGTGKTLLALAAALSQTTKAGPLFDQVIVARPVIPMGNDLGFLPGDINEKLTPWMQPIFDNLEVIISTPKKMHKDSTREIVKEGEKLYASYQYLIDVGILQVEALTYIRGRSLPKRYFIIDEAQNLRPLDVKTLVTRCGEGTKIVFTGDLNQIDTPYLDAESNGLAYLISRYINEPEFCYLNLTEGARSDMAAKAAMLL